MILYTIMSFLGSDYFIFMEVGKSLSYIHEIIYHTEIIRVRLFHFYGWVWGGGGEEEDLKFRTKFFQKKRYIGQGKFYCSSCIFCKLAIDTSG